VRASSWVAVDLVGGHLELLHRRDRRTTYLVRLDSLPDDEPSVGTVLLNLTDDERDQWVDALREDTTP